MRTARLSGPNHVEIGALDLVSEGKVAIALSRGGAPKTYDYVDPNEDCVGFAIGRAGILTAVADGHHGASAAEAAVSHLLDTCAPAWTAPAASVAQPNAWNETVLEVLWDLECQLGRSSGSDMAWPPATTVSIAVVRPEEGRLLYASVGDSHIFLCGYGAVREFGAATRDDVRPGFLGKRFKNRDSLAACIDWGWASIESARALVLATDGLSEKKIGVEDPAAVVATGVADASVAPLDLRAAGACRNVMEAALEAHVRHRSGDNASVAVVWLAPD